MTDTITRYFFSRIDWILLLLYLFFITWGWFNIFSIEFSFEKETNIFDFTSNYGKQMFWIAISVCLAFFILLINARFFSYFAYLIYGILAVVLIFVLFVGHEVSGSKSWLIITEHIRIQPSELMKVGVALAIAKFISKTESTFFLLKNQSISISLILFPTLLILLQKDTGSALVFSAFFLIYYRLGWSASVYISIFWLIGLFILTFLLNHYFLIATVMTIMFILTGIFRKNRKLVFTLLYAAIVSSVLIAGVEFFYNHALKPHQKDRIMILLGKKTDPHGTGYNINQSLIAIGSGSFVGKGYMKGTQAKFDFVPEQTTDFIFCSIGEEWGFIGSFVLISAFLIMMIRIIILAEKQRSFFSCIYGYILASVLFFHFFVNIAMTVNILPVIGIPLPFFSYGGSSLVSFTVLLFIFIKLNMQRNILL